MTKQGVKTNATAWQPTTQAPSKGTFTARPFPEIGQQEQETASLGEKGAPTVNRSGGIIANINRSMARNPIPASNVGIAGVQAKLTIGEPGDRYEQEADKVAAEVVQKMNAPEAPPITPPPRGEAEDKSIQRKPVIPIISRMPAPREDIQRKGQIKAGNVPDLQADFERQVNQARGGGSPLDAAFRAKIEPAMGADFSRVRVHTDSRADQMSQAIQAKAFTTGQDVFFRQGAYDPGSRGGQELIAHELTHVVQQREGEETPNGRKMTSEDAYLRPWRLQRRDASVERQEETERRGSMSMGRKKEKEQAVGGGDGATTGWVQCKTELSMNLSGENCTTPTVERMGQEYQIMSPGEMFIGQVDVNDDEKPEGELLDVGVEGGFLQKLVNNEVEASYGVEGNEAKYKEENNPPYKDTARSGGAWTYEDDQTRYYEVWENGGHCSFMDKDVPRLAVPTKTIDGELRKVDALLEFEVAFLAKETKGQWQQVNGTWSWGVSGDVNDIKSGKMKKNEITDIEEVTEKSEVVWNPEAIRALPHANTSLNVLTKE